MTHSTPLCPPPLEAALWLSQGVELSSRPKSSVASGERLEVPSSRIVQPKRLHSLDGLRALAVVLVFAHHVDQGSLPGGFVGVDVFFVIRDT